MQRQTYQQKWHIGGRRCLYMCCLLSLVFVFYGAQKPEKDTLIKQETKVHSHYARTIIPKGMRVEDLDLEHLPDLKTLHKIASVYLGPYALFFIAIKMEESGTDNKESGLSRKYNNLTGMRFPQKRETYAIGTTSTRYAIYRNWFESMLDFKIYMDGMERAFWKKNKRSFENEYEMLDFLYMYFNGFEKWRQDMVFLIRHVKKVYGNEVSEEAEDILILDTEVLPF